MQRRSKEFTIGGQPGDLGDKSLQQSLEADLRWGPGGQRHQKRKTNVRVEMGARRIFPGVNNEGSERRKFPSGVQG